MLYVFIFLIALVFGGWYFLIYIPDRDNKNNKNIKKLPKNKE